MESFAAGAKNITGFWEQGDRLLKDFSQIALQISSVKFQSY